MAKEKKKSQESRYKIVQRIIIIIINSNRSFVIRNTTQRMVQRSRELILNGLQRLLSSIRFSIEFRISTEFILFLAYLYF